MKHTHLEISESLYFKFNLVDSSGRVISGREKLVDFKMIQSIQEKIHSCSECKGRAELLSRLTVPRVAKSLDYSILQRAKARALSSSENNRDRWSIWPIFSPRQLLSGFASLLLGFALISMIATYHQAEKELFFAYKHKLSKLSAPYINEGEHTENLDILQGGEVQSRVVLSPGSSVGFEKSGRFTLRIYSGKVVVNLIKTAANPIARVFVGDLVVEPQTISHSGLDIPFLV